MAETRDEYVINPETKYVIKVNGSTYDAQLAKYPELATAQRVDREGKPISPSKKIQVKIKSKTEEQAFKEVVDKTKEPDDSGLKLAEEPEVKLPRPVKEKEVVVEEEVEEEEEEEEIDPLGVIAEQEEELEREKIEHRQKTEKIKSMLEKGKYKEEDGEEGTSGVVTLRDKPEVKENETFVRILEDKDPERVVLETVQYINGAIEPIDKYAVTIETGEAWEEFSRTGDRTVFNEKIKDISKKLIKKEVAFAKKKKESKNKMGRILTREDKVKFLKRI